MLLIVFLFENNIDTHPVIIKLPVQVSDCHDQPTPAEVKHYVLAKHKQEPEYVERLRKLFRTSSKYYNKHAHMKSLRG